MNCDLDRDTFDVNYLFSNFILRGGHFFNPKCMIIYFNFFSLLQLKLLCFFSIYLN